MLAGLTRAPVSDGDLTQALVGWWLDGPGSHVTTIKSFWTCFYGGTHRFPGVLYKTKAQPKGAW